MKPKMVIITNDGWLNTFQRPHQLAKKFRELYFIEVIAQPKYFPGFSHYAKEQLKLTDKITHVYGLGGSSILPFIKKINEWVFAKQFDRLYRSRSFKQAEIIYSWSTSRVSHLEHLRSKFFIFDAMDDWSEFVSEPIEKQKIIKNELKIAERANLILTVSEKPYTKFRQINPNTLFVRNGVDLEHFSINCMEYKKSQEDELFPFKEKPIIGYMGHLNNWVDLDLILKTAHILKDYMFVIIGPAGKDEVSKLKKAKNIKYLGYKAYTELPKYISYFSVGIIPFKLNLLIESTNPIKLYEYLGAGLPVVSTSMKEVSLYKKDGLVYTADGADEFSEAIRKALAVSVIPELIEQRVGLAASNSWNKRATDILKAVSRIQKNDLVHPSF